MLHRVFVGYQRRNYPLIYLCCTNRSSETVYSISRENQVLSTTVRIVKTPDILHGKPRIEGTRIGIFQVGELVGQHDWSLEDVTREFDQEFTTVISKFIKSRSIAVRSVQCPIFIGI